MENNLTPPSSEQANGNPQKSRTGMFITIALIAVVLLGISGYFFWQQKTIDENAAESAINDEEHRNAVNSIFSVSQYDAIPENYREFIYNFLEYNKFLDGTYFLTKISDRARSVYAFGDFTSDDNDENDLAVLFEYNDYKSSKLVIFNHKGEGLYINDYDNELPVINSFKVGSKIYMNEAKLVPAPCDGLIVKTDHSKYAIVYDKKTKKFNSYYQYSEDEIKSMNEEENYEEEYGEPEEETSPEPSSIINSLNEDSN